MKRLAVACGTAGVLAFATGALRAQSNSLFKDGRVNQPGDDAVRTTSLVRVVKGADRVFKKHDLLTIRVREQTKSKSVADSDSDKSTTLRAVVDSWPYFGKNFAVSDVSPAQPEVLKVSAARKFEGGASKRRDDTFAETVTGEIVDVKPNGTLVIEATKERQWMGEVQVLKVTGVVRREDVDEDNTVSSENIANLSLSYTTRGQVEASTRRGLFDRLLDFLNIF